MNILAHVFLSDNHPQLQIGNFIADFIKANQFTHLPLRVQQGIFLHRQIDTFTDAHPIVKQSKRRLHTRYGLYNGIIIDIFYDHFLAKNWSSYHPIPLADFASKFYAFIQAHLDLLPPQAQHVLPYMIQDNWLLNYQYFEGIEKTLIGMNKRTKLKSQMHLAISDLKLHYHDFESDFTIFFENLITFCDQKIKAL